MTRRSILLDTSPLITLCTFSVAGQLIIEHLLEIAAFTLVSTVVAEATANPAHADAAVVKRLLDEGRLLSLPVVATPLDTTIDNYIKLGIGERDTIRVASAEPSMPLVLDDYLAFVIASRFSLTPILLLDLIVSFVNTGELERSLARAMVDKMAPRYSTPFVEHTRLKLEMGMK